MKIPESVEITFFRIALPIMFEKLGKNCAKWISIRANYAAIILTFLKYKSKIFLVGMIYIRSLLAVFKNYFHQQLSFCISHKINLDT